MPRDAAYWIRELDLRDHPEGGHYRETYRSEGSIAASALPGPPRGDRAYSTAIYYLLRSDEVSLLHRLRSDELFHFYLGSPLVIHEIDPRGGYRARRLGTDPSRGESPQVVVLAGRWFGATVDAPDTFSLVGCTVAPGFDFDDFETGDRSGLLRLCPDQRPIIERLTR